MIPKRGSDKGSLEVCMDEYWTAKVQFAAQISKTMGFPEQDEEFWTRQPCGVISLLVELCDVIKADHETQLLQTEEIERLKLLMKAVGAGNN